MRKILKGFYVIEGLDGAGTTTQMRLVSKALLERGIKVFSTFEPTSGEIGLLIKRVLKGETSVTPLSLAYLYAADRENHLNNPDDGIVKHLSDSEIVISDRYMFSSYAYQTLKSPFEKVVELNKDFPYPETVFYVDTPVSECIRRINTRGNKKEIFEHQSILEAVKANYEKSFSMLPEEVRIIRIDGTLSVEEIFSQIILAF